MALVACATLVAIAATGATGSNGRAALPGSVPAWANSNNQLSAADPSSWVNFRVYLSLRNQPQAASLAQAVSTPGSAQFGKFLSPGQFNQQFAPSNSDVGAVSSWLQSQGLAVDYTPSNNHYVAAEGTVAQVQAAFGTPLNEYNVNGLTLRGNAASLSVPSSLAPTVAGVVGIDQSNALVQPENIGADATPSAGFRNAPPCSSYWAQYTTANTKVEGVTLPDYAGSARPFAPCGYGPQALRQAYGVDRQSATGQGVTIAIIDAYASPTIVQDAQQYFSNRGFPGFSKGQFTQVVAPGTYNHPEAGIAQDPQGWYGEETLDVEAAHSMAPGAKIVYVGAPNNYQDLDAAMNHVVANHLADIVTNSYGFAGEALPPGYEKPLNDTMLQGSLEGISILFSSGDSGDETLGIAGAKPTPDWPAVSPYVTAVGGTSLAAGTSAANPGTYVTETGWGTKRSRLNCSSKSLGDLSAINNLSWCSKETYLYGSGGGTSRIFAEPLYQQGNASATQLANQYGTGFAGRVVPDLAAVGDPNTGMLVGQTQTFSGGVVKYDEYRLGGTSLSSPLMAGMLAVAEQIRGGALGLANYALYSLPATAYHDVVDPSNPLAVVRVDYVNGEDSSNGVLYSIRHSNVTNTLATTAGYDDVTGLGTPTASFFPALAAWGK